MCEIVDPSTSRSVRLACAGDLEGKYKIYNHKSENEDQMLGTNTNEIFYREGVLAQKTEHIHFQVIVVQEPKKAYLN